MVREERQRREEMDAIAREGWDLQPAGTAGVQMADDGDREYIEYSDRGVGVKNAIIINVRPGTFRKGCEL